MIPGLIHIRYYSEREKSNHIAGIKMSFFKLVEAYLVKHNQ